MEIEIQKIRELMLKAFRVGRNKSNDYPARMWVELELDKLIENKK